MTLTGMANKILDDDDVAKSKLEVAASSRIFDYWGEDDEYGQRVFTILRATVSVVDVFSSSNIIGSKKDKWKGKKGKQRLGKRRGLKMTIPKAASSANS